MWIVMAALSAFFAGITAILAKCGIHKTDSDIATAVRTTVVLIFAWLMAAIKGSISTIGDIDAKSLVFLILSGLATGASWICYFKALSRGDVNKVVPVDKSSVVLSVIFAIVILQETSNLWVKLIGTTLIAIGTLFMVEKRQAKQESAKGRWLIYAVLSAVFAALTSILAKIGVSHVESNLATAIRTGVVLIMAWAIVFFQGKHKQVPTIPHRELWFICLSGVATGASYALQNGIVSVVVPIDKLSIVVSIAFSYIVFHEKLSKKAWMGLLLIILGTLLMAIYA